MGVYNCWENMMDNTISLLVHRFRFLSVHICKAVYRL
jgi:hypothetical protein